MFDTLNNNSEIIFLIKDDEISHITYLEEKILDLIKKEERDIVLDLQNLTVIDSVTLSVFIRIKRKLDAEDRIFRLTNYNQNILRVIELSGLEDFLLG